MRLRICSRLPVAAALLVLSSSFASAHCTQTTNVNPADIGKVGSLLPSLVKDVKVPGIKVR